MLEKPFVCEDNHSNIHLFSQTLLSVAHHLLMLFPIGLSVLVPYFLSASHPGRHSLLYPPILLQPGVDSRNAASPSLVSSIVAVHLLGLCECEGCSSLRHSYSSSTYPSVEPWWWDEWACMRLGAGGVLLGWLTLTWDLHTTWQKNAWLLTSGTGKLKLTACARVESDISKSQPNNLLPRLLQYMLYSCILPEKLHRDYKAGSSIRTEGLPISSLSMCVIRLTLSSKYILF